MVSHTLYFVRHGEQLDAEHGLPDGPLSPRGRRQARAIADRLGGVDFTESWHSPLQRAAETAQIIGDRLPSVQSQPTALLFDCIPSGPTSDMPSHYAAFYGGVTAEEIEAGRAQMADAVAEFLHASRANTNTLLITHNFVISWFVRHVFDAPDWRWMVTNQANCGLTIIQQKAGRAPNLIMHNDLAHLPVELRTGLPEVQSV